MIWQEHRDQAGSIHENKLVFFSLHWIGHEIKVFDYQIIREHNVFKIYKICKICKIIIISQNKGWIKLQIYVLHCEIMKQILVIFQKISGKLVGCTVFLPPLRKILFVL